MAISLPPRLQALKDQIEGYARDYGLDFFETVFEVLSYDEINMVAAYGGFPNRYPHWRFGMEYEQLSKGYEYGLSKIYEMVINNDPCYAYLLEANAEVDQKLVMAHVYGHCDFFKNNFMFAHTNRKMMDVMANHATRVRRWVDKLGVEPVEDFVDRCLSLENLIDYHAPFIKRHPSKEKEEQKAQEITGFKVDREYMRDFVNPHEFIEAQRKKQDLELLKAKKFPERPQRDVLLFLMENAPLERWEFDVLSIIRDEAYYFAPQGQTKVMNEGWACVDSKTLVFSDRGLVPMAEVVADGKAVSDGAATRAVYGRNIIRDHETVTVTTRRGLALRGSNNHRILRPGDDEAWVRLDELRIGDEIRVSGGAQLWAKEEVALDWKPPVRRTLTEVAEDAGVSVWTVLRHRDGKNVRQSAAVAEALVAYDDAANQATSHSLPTKRRAIRVPKVMDEHLAKFTGYLVGDGHISEVKRNLGLTTGDIEQAIAFANLAVRLFDLPCSMKKDEGRWRVLLHSENAADFLVEALGLTTGPSAHEKEIPAAVLRSPEPVVRAFLRAYFDCDGYAGKQGVILSTMSDKLAEQTQLLLLNYGILSRKRRQTDGCWHLHIAGESAAVFAEKVGFNLDRKQTALARYVGDHAHFKKETWTDEVVAIETGRADVYDISVEETHRYAAGGFINHNSYWHSTIMTTRALTDSEVIDYADHHAGTMGGGRGPVNPYKLGIELYRHIEDRWNKGRFGKEYDDCDDMRARQAWDRKLGLGREKIFEVRRHYNDVTFIDEFLTPEFCKENLMFVYGYNDKHQAYEIIDRDFRKIKEKLLHQLTNFGQPIIEVVDGNFDNRGELLLTHKFDGLDLKLDEARETLVNLSSLWRRPVNIVTKVEGKGLQLRFDGKEHSEKKVEL